MNTITKEQWAQIEEELKSSIGSVTFTYSDHELLVRRVRVSESRWELGVYIDNQINFGWGWPTQDTYNPLVEKLWRQRSKAVYTPKQQRDIIKAWGKRRAKKEWPNLEKKHIWYDPIFTTANSLIRHYRKIEGLEVVSIGYKPGVEIERLA